MGAKTLIQMRGSLDKFTEDGLLMFEFVRALLVYSSLKKSDLSQIVGKTSLLSLLD